MNNLKLVVAAISGEIYLAKILKSGLMGEQRKEFTNDCVRAVMEYCMAKKLKQIRMTAKDDSCVFLFHTADGEKADRILAILKEGEETE